jgi:predicted kinase
LNWYKKAQTKQLYILRGISGSGKSYLSDQIKGEDGIILSADDFFMEDGVYKFDPDKLPQAHSWTQYAAYRFMEEGRSPLIIDNTNIEAWEMKPYVEAAQKYGYNVEIIESNTPWRFDADELAKRNKHGVPQEVIEDMIERYQHDLSVDDIMESEPPEGVTYLKP